MSGTIRKVLVTGANGFIGKNTITRLNELPCYTTISFLRTNDLSELPGIISEVDAVIHLAGENRPNNDVAYTEINIGLTSVICEAIKQEYFQTKRYVPLLLASSTQVEQENPYGLSKLGAEKAVLCLSKITGNPCIVFRLPGVFGKWCKPNYNSVVATYCNNIARNIPIKINDPKTNLQLVYIDDVVDAFINSLNNISLGYSLTKVEPEYTINLEKLAKHIYSFQNCRSTLMVERVGQGLIRALYSTYISYLPTSEFSYELLQHADQRGNFVEMLKTPDCGQFSYFTAHSGMTRGGHYHHTKTEKFLVIKGSALFRFRHLTTNELFELKTKGENPQIVDTIPGWSHEITNIGEDDIIVMLWANENFNRQNPDTISREV